MLTLWKANFPSHVIKNCSERDVLFQFLVLQVITASLLLSLLLQWIFSRSMCNDKKKRKRRMKKKNDAAEFCTLTHSLAYFPKSNFMLKEMWNIIIQFHNMLHVDIQQSRSEKMALQLMFPSHFSHSSR